MRSGFKGEHLPQYIKQSDPGEHLTSTWGLYIHVCTSACLHTGTHPSTHTNTPNTHRKNKLTMNNCELKIKMKKVTTCNSFESLKIMRYKGGWKDGSVVPEKQGSLCSTHISQLPGTPAPGARTLFRPPQALSAHVVQRHMQAKIHAHFFLKCINLPP